MRTTVDIDAPVLRAVKELQRREGKSLGRTISDLLQLALAHRAVTDRKPAKLNWTSKTMGSRVELSDRDAIYDAMDIDER
ncbi:MAG: antitoxin [Myxococcota bacterium]